MYAIIGVKMNDNLTVVRGFYQIHDNLVYIGHAQLRGRARGLNYIYGMCDSSKYFGEIALTHQSKRLVA